MNIRESAAVIFSQLRALVKYYMNNERFSSFTGSLCIFYRPFCSCQRKLHKGFVCWLVKLDSYEFVLKFFDINSSGRCIRYTAAPSIQMHHSGSKPWRFRNVTVKLNKHTSSFFIFFSMATWSRGSEVSVNAVKLFRVEPSHSVKDLQRFSASSMLLSSSCSCLMVS